MNSTIEHIIGTAVKATLGGKVSHSFIPEFFTLKALWQSMMVSLCETECKHLCQPGICELVETVLTSSDSWLRKSGVSEEIGKFLKGQYADDKISLNNFVHGFITWRVGKSFASAIYRSPGRILRSQRVIADVMSTLESEPGKIEMLTFLDLYWVYHP